MDYSSAVAKTKAYSAFFSFPLYPKEIHHWLISSNVVSLSSLLPFLDKTITPTEEKTRQKLKAITAIKISEAKEMVAKLKNLPGIQMIALTGSVAVGNSKEGDDIDVLVVVSPNCLWIIRPIFLISLSLFFRRRLPGQSYQESANLFCPNLWLDRLSLSIPKNKRNLYTAHEVLQILPLFDPYGTYYQLLKNNSWVNKYLANAYKESLSVYRTAIQPQKHKFLSKTILLFMNRLFYILQVLYMRSKKTTETIALHQAYFHTVDYATILHEYLKSHKDI